MPAALATAPNAATAATTKATEAAATAKREGGWC